MTPIRAHFLWMIAVFVLVVGSVGAFNFAVDVKGLFHRDKGSGQTYLAALQMAKLGVVWPDNDRPVKLALAETTEADCAAVGSSHLYSMTLESLRLAGEPCGTFVNLGVGTASLEDLVILAASAAGRPTIRRLYFSIDLWTFKWGSNPSWTVYEERLKPAKAVLGLAGGGSGGSGLLARLRNLANLKYLTANMAAVRGGGWQNTVRPIDRLEDVHEHDALMRSDGSMRYSDAYMALRPMPWSKLGNGGYRLAPPYWQKRAFDDLATVVRTLKARGVEVVLMMTPYHPKVFACASEQACAAIPEIRGLVRELAGSTGARVVGDYDGRRLGLEGDDFLDDMHAAAPHYFRVLLPAREPGN